MTSSEHESTVDNFLSFAGSDEGGRFVLRTEVLARLVQLLTELGDMRLGLLSGLQTALPRGEEGSPVEELKETLTNLIIMQSRTAGRESGVAETTLNLALAGGIQPVVVDREKLQRGLAALLEAAERVRNAGGASSLGA